MFKRIVASALLAFALCPAARAIPGDGGGVLNQQTINITNVDSYYAQVMAAFGVLNTFFLVDPLQPLNAASRDGLTNHAFGILGIGLGDVAGFDSQDIYLNTLIDVHSSVQVTEEPGTVFIGDPDDPSSISVITGQLNIITTNTTTESRLHELSLTGDLLEEPDPGPGSSVPEPSTMLLLAGGLVAMFVRRRD